MTVEVADFISQLDPTNPTGTGQKHEGDNQFQLLKHVLQTQFPNFSSVVNATPAQLNQLVGITSSVIDTAKLAALPAGIGTTTPVAGYFTTLRSNGIDVALSTRNMIAGNGLTGGGTLAADRTFNVGAGTGISVGADTVGLDTANTRNVDHAGVSINVSGGLLSGGGTLAATRTITLTSATIQALVGAMLSGNTETNITVTYQSSDGTIDFVVPTASTGGSGVVELATSTEVDTGTDTARAISPGTFGATKSLAAQGYYKFPGGLTLQWGTLSVGGNTFATETFSRTFTSVYSVVCSAISTGLNDGDNTGYVSSVTTADFRIYNGVASTYSFYWFAVGAS